MDGYDRLLLVAGVYALLCFIGVSLYTRYHNRVMREQKEPRPDALTKITSVGEDADFDRRDDSN